MPSCTAGCQLACCRLAQLGSQGGDAEPKHNGSEGRIGPAAGSPEGQTWLSDRPRNWLQTLLLLALLLCQLPTCLRRLAAGFCAARLRSRDPLAGLKHHGSEGRSGPAAGSPYCQTSLSELPRNSLQTLLFPAVSSGPRTLSQAPIVPNVLRAAVLVQFSLFAPCC